MYIQDIESTHEYTTKGTYFLITTKTDYKKATIEAKDTLQYVYPNRKVNKHSLFQSTKCQPSGRPPSPRFEPPPPPPPPIIQRVSHTLYLFLITN